MMKNNNSNIGMPNLSTEKYISKAAKRPMKNEKPVAEPIEARHKKAAASIPKIKEAQTV